MSKPAPEPDPKKKALQILGPAVAVAAVVLLIALVVGVDRSTKPTNLGALPPMAGKFDFPLDSPDWKPGDGGLKIWDVREGTGEPCPTTATVNVHYAGFLTNGTKFDSSLDRGKPIEFKLSGVIKGWTLGIPGMKVGGIRRLFIPPDLGYGPRGSPPKIPPNSDLVFEVEMLSFR